jgi:hypothetical protein
MSDRNRKVREGDLKKQDDIIIDSARKLGEECGRIKTEPMIGQPTSTFNSLTSEAMSHISELQTVVDNLIDQLEPVLKPQPTAAGQQANVPLQAGSQFTEFLDSLSRRADIIRERVAETMSRLSI